MLRPSVVVVYDVMYCG